MAQMHPTVQVGPYTMSWRSSKLVLKLFLALMWYWRTDGMVQEIKFSGAVVAQEPRILSIMALLASWVKWRRKSNSNMSQLTEQLVRTRQL